MTQKRFAPTRHFAQAGVFQQRYVDFDDTEFFLTRQQAGDLRTKYSPIPQLAWGKLVDVVAAAIL
jgi:hypothetical protein